MGFRLFKKERTTTGPPRITLGKHGHMVLNAVAMRTFFSNVKFVHLLWDVEGRKIGIRPAKRPDANTYQISKGSGTNAGSISGKAFIQMLGEQFKGKTQSFDLIWNEAEGLAECSTQERKSR